MVNILPPEFTGGPYVL